MDNFLALVAPIAAIGALYVVAPVAVGAYRRFRRPRQVTCPETGTLEEIQIDAAEAARSAAFGRPELHVFRCSRWPERHYCNQECLRDVH